MTPEISDWLSRFQNQVTDALESFAPSEPFQRDPWQRNAETSLQGYGETRILEHGSVFERAGVGLSCVHSTRLPPAATKNRPELIGQPFRAMGVSVVVHPRNPYAPTAHLNIRCLQAGPENAPLATWFGGGFDLTPYYGFEEDARHWHECAQIACSVAGETAYPKFKAECDQYFYLPHRQEARGIGGIFFDDYGEDNGFALIQNVGAQFLAAYVPIVARRASTPYGERERAWQLYRRGRYVEFNLVHDRGTHFGLQSGGRTESILLSMPPLVTWAYQHQPEAHSPEAKLLSDFLPIRNWI